MILWGFTGFCFAQRYVHAPIWGCVLSALIFVTIIVQIERQIILTVGTSKVGVIFRLFIAIIMAFLGSAIIDQVIFGEDIKRKMVEITDRQVTELLPIRLKVIDDKYESSPSEKLIEHLMIAANHCVAKYILTCCMPSCYRNHLNAPVEKINLGIRNINESLDNIKVMVLRRVNSFDRRICKNKENSYPYIVVETNLNDLPDLIELNTSIDEN